jgi:integrase
MRRPDLGELGHAIVYMDAFTGLRRNEILVLEFTDIDWFTREVSVSKAISKRPAWDGVHKWEWVHGEARSHLSRSLSTEATGPGDNSLGGIHNMQYK